MRILLRMAKAAVNLSISDVILREARALKLNLSQVLEEGLRERLRRRRAEKWLEENRAAIEHFNARIERDGPLNSDLLSF
jgi:antitoxin CcdA